MPSQDKLIKTGIHYTDALFLEILNRLKRGIRQSDTLESFLINTKDYTMNNPLIVSGYNEKMINIILQETNNHRFSRPAQKELTRVVIENRVGDLITNVGEDLKNNIREIVKHGYNNNLSQKEIADNITKTVNTIKNTRARTIARTEIARTATASDYVINKERGATHFTVDCRDTCCEVCARDYNWGKKEYRINQVEMLPPRHPNCRCVVMFYIKETNPFSNDGLTFQDDGDTFEVLPYIQLTEDKLPNSFSDNIKKGFLKFDKEIENAKYEFNYISNITTDNVGEIYSDKKSDNVSPRTNIVINIGDELLAAHNHRSHMPFNYKDFKVIFKETNLYAKYLVVHTPTDVFICELEPTARYYCEEILDEINSCYGEGLRKVGVENYKAAGEVWDNYKSNEFLNKYMSFRRIRK